VNAETKEKSKQWMHTHSPKKPKNFKQTLPVTKLMATVFWDKKGVLAVRGHNNMRYVLESTREAA
jgi:6-pyruvoyl-tetrahydropterin synthase